MRQILRIGAATIALIGPLLPAASGAVLLGPTVNPANGHIYYLLGSSGWTDAESTAQAMGGTLATVRNATENDWLLTTFGDYGGMDRFLLIGFYDPSRDQIGGSHASNFGWADGESVTYTNWNPGEPNNNGDEYWTEMYPANVPGTIGVPAGPPGTWNDVPNVNDPYQNDPFGHLYGPAFGVVEVVPEPEIIGLLGFGYLLLRHHRTQF